MIISYGCTYRYRFPHDVRCLGHTRSIGAARDGLDAVKERLYMVLDAPVFGVVRWERGDEVWILHRSHREERRKVAIIE